MTARFSGRIVALALLVVPAAPLVADTVGPAFRWTSAPAEAGAYAHHSVLGFDATRPLTLRGMVTDVRWRNPHTYISVAVEGGGSRAIWVIESESAVVLQRLGWSAISVRRGDRIHTVGAPARDGARLMRCQYVEAGNGA